MEVQQHAVRLAHALVKGRRRRLWRVKPGRYALRGGAQLFGKVLVRLVERDGQAGLFVAPVGPKITVKAIHIMLIGLVEQGFRVQPEFQDCLRPVRPVEYACGNSLRPAPGALHRQAAV